MVKYPTMVGKMLKFVTSTLLSAQDQEINFKKTVIAFVFLKVLDP